MCIRDRPTILRNVLFERGSHILAVIPENSVDDLINGDQVVTMESLTEAGICDSSGTIHGLGILGPSKKETTNSTIESILGISVENFHRPQTVLVNANKLLLDDKDSEISVESVTITDNINLLRVPFISEKLRSQRINTYATRISNEETSIKGDTVGRLVSSQQSKKENALKDLTDNKIQSLFYKNSRSRYTPIISLKTESEMKRRAIGAPLVMELPSESVIPVFTPGNKNKHIGYFVLLDNNGNPVCKDDRVDYYSQLQNRFNGGVNGTDQSSKIIEMVKRGMGNSVSHINREHVDSMAKIYADKVEKDLINRLKNGIYTNGAELGNNQEIYLIMLARVLSGQQTQLLYIPVEFMSYFALKYDENGMGKSLLDDMKVLNSLRVVVMFSNIMASVRNSIGKTAVNIKLDEDDPDPQKTIEMLMDNFMRTRSNSFPVGNSNPADIVSHLSRAGVEFVYEGHPGLPDVKTDISEKSTNAIKPDTELDDMLRKRSIQATGVSPEMVDAGSGAEFATSVANNHILLSRRVIQIQDSFAPQLTSHVRKVFYATPSLVEEAKNFISEDYSNNLSKLSKEQQDKYSGPEAKEIIVNLLLDQFMLGLEVTMPRPNSVTVDNQQKSLESYIDLLDKCLDSIISDQFITEQFAGEVANSVGSIKETFKAYFIRKYMAENGIMPELSDITAVDEFGKPKIDIWNEQKQHIQSIVESLGSFMKDIDKTKTESNSDLEQSGIGDITPSSTDSDSSSDSSDTGVSGDFGDMGGDIDAINEASQTDTGDTPQDTETQPETSPNDDSAADTPTDAKTTLNTPAE